MERYNGNESVLVIVVTYNARVWIDRCFDSLRKSTHKVSVYVVDNGSADGSLNEIRTRYPEAIIADNKENLGFGKANNMGLKYALEHGFDYVYLLNQDAWVMPDTIGEMVQVAKNNREYGVLSPIQLGVDGKVYETLFYKYVICSDELRCSYHEKLLNKENMSSVYSVPFVMAAHWLISKECIEKVGGFSPTFFHYGEDNNYLQRVFFKGFKVGIVPGAKAVHDSRMDSRKTLRDNNKYRMYNSELVYLSNPNTNYLVLNSVKSFLLKFLIERDFSYVKIAWKLLKEKTKIETNKCYSKGNGAFL